MTLEQWEALPEGERGWWLERQRRRLDTHDCGYPRDVCADPERVWFPQLQVCHVAREQQAAWAKFEALHQERPWHDGTMRRWSEKRSAAFPYHYTHGTHVFVAEADLGLGGDFLLGSRQPDGDEP